MGSQRIYYTSLIFLVAFPTRGRAEQTGGSQSEGESRPSLSALRFKQFVSLKFLLGSAPRIQCNLRCPTLDKYPPALIQVTLHRRVQQRGFQDSGGGKTLRTWRRERACWSKVFQVSSEWIWRHRFRSWRGRQHSNVSRIQPLLSDVTCVFHPDGYKTRSTLRFLKCFVASPPLKKVQSANKVQVWSQVLDDKSHSMSVKVSPIQGLNF